MNVLYPIAAAGIGMAFALQPVINSAGTKVLGSPVAVAVISVAITLLFLLALLPFTAGSLRPALLVGLPWWIVFGGLIGVAIVAGGAAVVPVTGAALFIVCLIAGQLVGSALIDAIGAFGMPQRPLGLTRIMGLALVLIGALLVRAD